MLHSMLKLNLINHHMSYLGPDVSIADLLCVCELLQPSIGGEDVTAGRPKLRDYMKRVQSRLNPQFDEAHKILYRARDNMAKSKL